MYNVSLVHADGEATPVAAPKSACIGLLFNDDALARMVVAQLDEHVTGIPCVSLAQDIETTDIDPAQQVRAAEVFLVSDWPLDKLQARFALASFPSVMLVGALDVSTADAADVLAIPIDEQTGARVADEVRSRLFPTSDTQRLQLVMQNEQQEQWLAEIGTELSVFYHSISNPLTILSGNIQLLQMLTESMQISADLMKPIADIATVSARFEEDLKAIAALKEKIKAGNLEKGTPQADTNSRLVP